MLSLFNNTQYVDSSLSIIRYINTKANNIALKKSPSVHLEDLSDQTHLSLIR